MQSAQPLEQWLADARTDPALRQQLVLAQRIRRFAVAELKLPDNASYQRYADLKRSAVVWNVVAAPALSLSLKTWCFPVMGCVGYRGYFNEAQARAFADVLQQEGLEVSVYGVPAYSTLGWLNWAGGDPLLNTFINYPEGALARLLIHEMAHQVVYAPDDTMFNESFATAVERLGGERWLNAQGAEMAKNEYATLDNRRRQFRALGLAMRQRLADIYKKNNTLEKDQHAVIAMKNRAFQDFREDYARLKISWGGYTGYDAWVAGANNATFGAQAAYDELEPGFEALFKHKDQDWLAFYDAVKRLAQLPSPQRAKALQTPSSE